MRAVFSLLLSSIALPANADEAGTKNRLSEKAAAVLAQAEVVELISLLPKRDKSGGFRGWKELGRTKLTKKKSRKAAINAFKKGLKDSDGKAAKCFDPRHGFSASHAGTTVHVVICFECYQAIVWVGDERQWLTTTRGPQPALDKILSAAGVKLAPKSKSKD